MSPASPIDLPDKHIDSDSFRMSISSSWRSLLELAHIYSSDREAVDFRSLYKAIESWFTLDKMDEWCERSSAEDVILLMDIIEHVG